MKYQVFTRQDRRWNDVDTAQLFSLLQEDKESITPKLLQLFVNGMLVTKAGFFRLAIRRVE